MNALRSLLLVAALIAAALVYNTTSRREVVVVKQEIAPWVIAIRICGYGITNILTTNPPRAMSPEQIKESAEWPEIASIGNIKILDMCYENEPEVKT